MYDYVDTLSDSISSNNNKSIISPLSLIRKEQNIQVVNSHFSLELTVTLTG